MSKHCHACQHVWDAKRQPGWREECPNCEEPLHCCRNCKFYDETASQWCGEPMARDQRPRSDSSSNMCDFFLMADREAAEGGCEEKAKAGLAALFGESAEDSAQETADWMKTDPADKPDLKDLFE